MKIIVIKDVTRNNGWGDPNTETIFTYHTFSSFEKAKKECMKDFNKIYHYYDKYERYDPYGLYLPAIRKEKDGISILFTVYHKIASFEDVVGDEKKPVLEVGYRLIEVDKLPCD